MKHLHLAQLVSFLRWIFAPLTLVFLSDWEHKSLFLLILVILSGVTDFLDGYIARTYNKTSVLGAIHDFTADKLFILSALLVFSVEGSIPAWISFIFLYREIAVMGMRIYTSFQKYQIKASMLGKLKTASLFAALIMMLLGWPGYMLMLYFSIATAVISFFDYFWKFRTVVMSEK
jgi:CDP-diacylglycerol--glycerol-3-phosphate 3-phosphatidyltransferase